MIPSLYKDWEKKTMHSRQFHEILSYEVTHVQRYWEDSFLLEFGNEVNYQKKFNQIISVEKFQIKKGG